jgi:hypothetical protein
MSTRCLYLAVAIDLSSRKIIGWSLEDNLRAELAVNALQQAIGSRSAAHQSIFHSDRRKQYGSFAFREVLRKTEIPQSMSARTNPYHNAWTDSLCEHWKPKCSTEVVSSTFETLGPKSSLTSIPTTTCIGNTLPSTTNTRPI